MRDFFCFSMILIGVTSGTSFGFGSKDAGFPEHYENKKWDANKPPIVDEPALQITKAATAWDKTSKEPSPFCDSKRSLTARDGSRLEAVGIKEKNIEVRGAFLRFRTCMLPEPEQGIAQGQGWVELSSWDSGLAARDRRVTRYVFGVEQDGQSVAPFEFKIEPWRLTPSTEKPGAATPEDTWDATLTAQVTFRGLLIPTEFPVTVLRKNGITRVYSRKDASVKFMNETVEKGFAEMMALCNHHFLASHALVSFDLNFMPQNYSGGGKSKKKANK